MDGVTSTWVAFSRYFITAIRTSVSPHYDMTSAKGHSNSLLNLCKPNLFYHILCAPQFRSHLFRDVWIGVHVLQNHFCTDALASRMGRPTREAMVDEFVANFLSVVIRLISTFVSSRGLPTEDQPLQ